MRSHVLSEICACCFVVATSTIHKRVYSNVKLIFFLRSLREADDIITYFNVKGPESRREIEDRTLVKAQFYCAVVKCPLAKHYNIRNTVTSCDI